MIDVITKIKRLSVIDLQTGGYDAKEFGIDRSNRAYPWFKKIILDRISDTIGYKLELLTAMFKMSKGPFGVHCDRYPDDDQDRRYITFLIPYSVDEHFNDITDAKTIIFNERDTFSQFPMNPTTEHLPLVQDEQAGAISIHSSDLTHIPVDTANVLTVRQILGWKIGSLLYWESDLLHCSNDFLAKGHASKECLVVFTKIAKD